MTQALFSESGIVWCAELTVVVVVSEAPVVVVVEDPMEPIHRIDYNNDRRRAPPLSHAPLFLGLSLALRWVQCALGKIIGDVV